MIPWEAVVVATRMVARADFLADPVVAPGPPPLRYARTPGRDPRGRSEVPGVWLAGNVIDPGAQIGASASAGSMAGPQITSS